MLPNYLKIAVRNLLKHRTYTLINVAGLAVGLACCTMLLLYVQRELSYDQHHQRLDQIHRILRETRTDDRVQHGRSSGEAPGRG
jgi:putative ABC transport system permease protein